MKLPRTLREILILLFQIVSILLSTSQQYEIIYGANNYTEYQVGDNRTNIVLASPHGGYLIPSSIPDRIQGCYDDANYTCKYSHINCSTSEKGTCNKVIIWRDQWTRELTISLANELQNLTGNRPHVIINNLHRSKLDANRPIDEAAFGISESEAAYKEFNAFIMRARNAVKGPGVFYDIHGHTQAKAWVMLGYRISKDDINNDNLKPENSSVKALAERHADISFMDLIHGSESLGGFLQAEGYIETVPSPKYPTPGSHAYYRGGYNTLMFGSYFSGVIDGIQIETPRIICNDKDGPVYVKVLARAIYKFHEKYYIRKRDISKACSMNIHVQLIIVCVTAAYFNSLYNKV